MPRRGILGLAGGSLVLVILALAYIFTDRGREVGDSLGRSLDDRLERLFPDEAGRGEGGGTEPEGIVNVEAPPEITDPAGQAPPLDPNGLPPAATPVIYTSPTAPGVHPGRAPGDEYGSAPAPRADAIRASLAALNAEAQGGAVIPAIPIGNARGAAAQAIYQNSLTPGNFGYGSYVRSADGSVYNVLDAPSFGRPSAREEIASGAKTASAQFLFRSGFADTPESAAAIAGGALRPDAAPAPRSETQARQPSRAVSSTPAATARAADRGRRLATQRQTVSPSQTRPREQTGSEILASYNSFRSNTNFNQRGAQM